MRVFEDKYLLRQGREPQQQADGDKAGNERGEDGGEFREEFLNTAGLLALQRLFLFGGDIGQRWRIRRASSSNAFIISAALCALPGPRTTWNCSSLTITPHYAVNLADGGAIGP